MPNYVVNGNLAAVTTALSSTVTYLALGTSSTAVAKTDAALGAVITGSGLDAAAATVTQQTTTATNDTLRLTKTWTASGSKSVTEVGAQTSGGVLHARCLFTSTKSVTSGDTITATINIIYAN